MTVPVTGARVAILGGSFDPITLGHVSVIDQAAAALGAAEAWLIPNRRQPLRPQPIEDVVSRIALARVAVTGWPRMRVLQTEADRQGPSYAVDTLDELERQHPRLELWWVLGADAAREIRRWHRAATLLARWRFAIVNRTGAPALTAELAMELGFPADRTRMLHVDSPRVSSTEVRDRISRGESIVELVGDNVAALIAELGLYRERP